MSTIVEIDLRIDKSKELNGFGVLDVDLYLNILDWLIRYKIEYTRVQNRVAWAPAFELEDIDAVAFRLKFGL
jgi:hypothetical protein